MTEVGEFINMEKMSHIYDPIEILINLGASFILGMIVSIVYKFTHKGCQVISNNHNNHTHNNSYDYKYIHSYYCEYGYYGYWK